MNSGARIPKNLHIIWVGDIEKQPKTCISSWQQNHPDWEFRLWADRDLYEGSWINQSHLKAFAEAGYWSAVADLMRYEILYRHGGVYVDADSFSLRPLDDWMLEAEMFACWENTLAKGRAQLVSNAFLGSVPDNPFLLYVIQTTKNRKMQFQRWSWSRMRFVRMGAWKSVGPYRLTKCIYDYKGQGYHGISILPSHMFCANHSGDNSDSGSGLVYADRQWAGTGEVHDRSSENGSGAQSEGSADGAKLSPGHL